MPFYSTAAQDAALDALWGSGHAASMPATFDVGLLTSDPRVGTVDEMPADGTQAATHWAIFVAGALFDFGLLEEPVTFAGYARIAGLPNDDTTWDVAADGMKSMQPQTFTGLDRPVTPTVQFNSTTI